MIVYLDFDGTVVEHQYPQIGRCNFGGYKVVKALQDAGWEIILNTYRADLGKEVLQKALDYINEMWAWDDGLNIDRPLEPMLLDLNPKVTSTEKKLHPHPWDLQEFLRNEIIYIDDSSYNVPLKPAAMSSGDMVDWAKIEFELKQFGVI